MAGWTDYNLDDGIFKNKLLGSTCEALRLAIIERCQASNTTIPNSLQDEISENTIPSKTWKNDFQSTITTLISKYANHTDNSGNWQGQANIPAWTEASILTAIEAESRIAAPDFFNAAWAEQQHRILNLLRWVRLYLSFQNSFGLIAYDTYYKNPGSGWKNTLSEAINEAVNYWNTSSWLSIAGNLYLARNYSTASYSGGQYAVQFYNLIGKLKASNYLYSEDRGCSVDFYSLAYNIGLEYGYTYNSVEGYTENQLQLINSVNESIDEFISSDEFGDRTRQIDPTETINYFMGLGPSYQDPITKTNYAIAKFDGPNGFTFKDWE